MFVDSVVIYGLVKKNIFEADGEGGGGIQGNWILLGQVKIWFKTKGPKVLMR